MPRRPAAPAAPAAATRARTEGDETPKALSRHTLSIEDPEIIPGPAVSTAFTERSFAQHRRRLAHRFAKRTRARHADVHALLTG